MAASANPRRLGLPRPSGDDDGGPFHVAIPREAVQFRIPRLSKSRGPGWHLAASSPRRDRNPSHGRNDDGPGSQRQRACISTSGLHLFLRGRAERVIEVAWANPRGTSANFKITLWNSSHFLARSVGALMSYDGV